MSKVEIINPRRSGSSITSLKQAKKYILQGKAVITKEGKLLFLDSRSQKIRNNEHQGSANFFYDYPDELKGATPEEDYPLEWVTFRALLVSDATRPAVRYRLDLSGSNETRYKLKTVNTKNIRP